MSEKRDYTQARCAWCSEGTEKNAHVFIQGHRISPACPEHARQYVVEVPR